MHTMLDKAQDERAMFRFEAEISKGVPPPPPLLPSLSCALEAEGVTLGDVDEPAACTVLDPKVDKRDCVNVAAESRVGSAAWLGEGVADEVVDITEEEAEEEGTAVEDASDTVVLSVVVEDRICVVCAVV